MNEKNWRRSRCDRALDLATCLRDGHSLSDHWPHVCGRRCGYSLASRYDPATPANILRVLAQSGGPWPPRDEPERPNE